MNETLSATERVVLELRAWIQRGALAPGERLTEPWIAEEFKVGRSTVREALRRLEADGLLVSERYVGVSVRRLGRDDIVGMLEVREALEGLAARTVTRSDVCKRILGPLKSLQTQMQTALSMSELARYNGLYAQFHLMLIEAAENPFLSRQWQTLNLLEFSYQLVPFITLDLLLASHDEHEALLNAMADGDARRAEACMRRHIAHFTESIRKLPDRRFIGEPTAHGAHAG
jgi:DNA-binding GntR family transcriptional regulator